MKKLLVVLLVSVPFCMSAMNTDFDPDWSAMVRAMGLRDSYAQPTSHSLCESSDDEVSGPVSTEQNNTQALGQESFLDSSGKVYYMCNFVGCDRAYDTITGLKTHKDTTH